MTTGRINEWMDANRRVVLPVASWCNFGSFVRAQTALSPAVGQLNRRRSYVAPLELRSLIFALDVFGVWVRIRPLAFITSFNS